MRTLSIINVKGGQGVSTLVAATGCLAVANGETVAIVSPDDDDDMSSILGGTTEGLSMFSLSEWNRCNRREFDFAIFDGFNGSHYAEPGESQTLVMTKACYVSLRTITRLQAGGAEYDGIVLFLEVGRALNKADIEQATGLRTVAVVVSDPAIARTVDAGMMSYRIPEVLKVSARTILS